jgi:serine/threonine-protein kinase RsbW
MILRLSLDLPEDTTYIRTTRLLSRCLMEDIQVSREVIDDVELILTELCSNVIRHSQSKETHFLVTLEFYKPQIVITVIDAGRGIAQEDLLPVGTARPDSNGGERYGGYGMLLLEGLSDKVNFTATVPHGTTVRVEKTLHYETRGDADEAAERDKKDVGVVTATKE